MIWRSIVRAAVIAGSCSLAGSCGWLPGWQDHVTATRRVPLPPPGRAAFYVVVEPGQSLDHIAQTYRVAASAIIAANRLGAPYAIKPGMLLEVPLAGRRRVVAARQRPAIKRAAHTAPRRVRAAKAKPMLYAKPRQLEVIPLD